jgi:hypothetical protein
MNPMSLYLNLALSRTVKMPTDIKEYEGDNNDDTDDDDCLILIIGTV